MKPINLLLLLMLSGSPVYTVSADEIIHLAAAIGAPEAVNRTDSSTKTDSETSGGSGGIRTIPTAAMVTAGIAVAAAVAIFSGGGGGGSSSSVTH